LARPQSMTWTSPKAPTMTLDGFRSRWTTSWAWAYPTAWQIASNTASSRPRSGRSLSTSAGGSRGGLAPVRTGKLFPADAAAARATQAERTERNFQVEVAGPLGRVREVELRGQGGLARLHGGAAVEPDLPQRHVPAGVVAQADVPSAHFSARY